MSLSCSVAEWLERHAGQRGVAGSIPGGRIFYFIFSGINDDM